jgi:hypothetical protein
LLYVLMMAYTVLLLFTRLTSFELAEFLLLALLLFISIGLGGHFIHAALHGDPDAWVTEHLAFVFFVACHMLLFFIDSGHRRAAGVCGTEMSGGYLALFKGVRIQLGS